MNKSLPKILFAVLVLAGLGYFFYSKSKDNDSVVNNALTKAAVTEDLSATYDKVPFDELYAETPEATAMLAELKERYKRNFEALVSEAKTTGAKLVFCWMTTEPTIAMQKDGRAFIEQLCRDNGVEFLDLNPSFDKAEATEITFMPVDGHFNAKGTRLVADYLAEHVRRSGSVRSAVTYSDVERPATFGDLDPNQKDQIEDGGKDLPYKVTTNSQGLRMDYDLTFPKTKQRVLLIGDSGFFCPFVDNGDTISGHLQSIFPDKEIINAASWGYGISDYNSLWNERVKYTEPDIVFLQSSGEDIASEFFSQRLRFSRHKDKVKPTESEKKFYATLK